MENHCEPANNARMLIRGQTRGTKVCTTWALLATAIQYTADHALAFRRVLFIIQLLYIGSAKHDAGTIDYG